MDRLVFAGRNWQPTSIERVTRVLNTSTKPISVVTDDGAAIVKYMGNPQGSVALICELVGTELANLIGLKTPDFAIMNIPALNLPGHPMSIVEQGPAFCSRWEEAVSLSPRSGLLKKLRNMEDLATLVVLDTWTRNKDRFSDGGEADYGVVNFDNVLLRRDKRMVELLVIDHTHAFVETTLEDELGQDWVDEQTIYGLFAQFQPFLTRKSVDKALAAVKQIDLATVASICDGVPKAWGMSQALSDRLSLCVVDRAKKLENWLPAALFDQYEMDLVQEGEKNEQ